MSKFIITLTDRELGLIAALCETFKKTNKDEPILTEPITGLEKSLSEQTAGKYGTIAKVAESNKNQ